MKITAVQDQASRTKYHATKILQTENDSKQGLGKQFYERVEHAIPACQILAREQYIRDMAECVFKYTLTYKRKKTQKLYNKHWYDHVPKSFATSYLSKVTILWIQQVRTDRSIHKNKPDIIILDNKKGKCMLTLILPRSRTGTRQDKG